MDRTISRIARLPRDCVDQFSRLARWTPAFVGITIATGMAACVLPAPLANAQSEPQSNSHSWVIWPQGGVAFPSGRFGEKDEDASAPKDGNKTGYAAGIEAGYFLSDFVCIGLDYSMSRFDLDVAETPGFDHSGHTSVWTAQAWGRFFLRGGYERWQPYVFAGVGLGRPTATLEFDPPTGAFQLPAEVTTLESTVDMTSSISGGVGVLIPFSSKLGLSFEPRYNSINTKGTARTDLLTQTDGAQAEVKEDNEGNRLKAKSNTNWWEIRLGLIFLLR